MFGIQAVNFFNTSLDLFKFKLFNLFMSKWHSAEASLKRTIKDTPLQDNSMNYVFTNFIQQKIS